ncbi:hypothetical protein IJI70_00515 [Candidatus Saccharibacteria bacterium]|nr:hypothetical protein [Candidatus Saccharibacteria bacterium]
MADYIFIRKSRNALSSFLHLFLNILLGVGSIFITVVSGSWIIGLFLVLISKWRMFAVRPRFWFLNLKSNLVDLIVGFSFVFLTYFSGMTLLPVHYTLTALYIIWLVIIKPITKESGNLIQSIFAIILGTSAVILATANLNSAAMILLEFFIGYGASRHVLCQNNNTKDFELTSLICGLLFSEISWLAHSWLIIYSFGTTGIILPQLAVILGIVAFVFHKVYAETTKRDGDLKLKDVTLPVFFGILTIAVIVLGFSNPFFNV